MKPFWIASLFIPTLALAQAAPEAPKPSGNLVPNGSFEAFTDADNLWDGVDGEGFLAGACGGAEAVNEGGGVGFMEMPISVQVADLNHDGLLDLFTVDPTGYFRIYFNSGTKTEPKFTNCEVVPLYISRFGWEWHFNSRAALKACLAELENPGTYDLVLGDWAGELLIIRNTGGSTVPEFRQPAAIDDKIRVETAEKGRLWGNLFAPAVYDWSGNRKHDFILGEGSYSANAIHLLINKGSGLRPALSGSGQHEYVAYGDGKEQLVPAVVDFNGDGQADLIVGDRLGRVTPYLAKGPWKPGVELTATNAVQFGDVATFNSCIAPTVADLNGDGLFDILIGKPNGRIAVAYNIGTATEPKFGNPVEIKGEDVYKPGTVRVPHNWQVDFGYDRGNIYGYCTVLKAGEEGAELPEGAKAAVKFGYVPTLNKIVKMSPFLFTGPADSKVNNAFRSPGAGYNGIHPSWNPMDAAHTTYWTDSNVAVLRQIFEVGILFPEKNYKFSFKVKGRGVKSAEWNFSLGGWGKKGEPKISRSKRTTTVVNNALAEEVILNGGFTASSAWAPVTRTLNFRFSDKSKELNAPNNWKGVGTPEYRGLLEIKIILAPGEGEVQISDVQLVPGN